MGHPYPPTGNILVRDVSLERERERERERFGYLFKAPLFFR